MNKDVLIDEQKFPYMNMTLEERNYYLNILRNCKDICDSDNKIDNQGKCELLRLMLKKENDIVRVEGFLTIGSNLKHENRCISADMYLSKDNIIVDMNIIRLSDSCEHKVYTVLDEFTLKDNVLKRRSQYNYDMKSLYNDIENEDMKGRLR